MQISRGDPMIFIDRPISATFLALAVLSVALMLLPSIRKGKDAALQGS
jgi:TctA family transporter